MSIGEVLNRALADTLMGMGTVFCILIIICLVISLFKFIPKEEKKTRPAPKIVSPSKSAADSGPVGDTDTDIDEDELIAVILAAIKMAKEREMLMIETPSGEIIPEPQYIVRSIRRKR